MASMMISKWVYSKLYALNARGYFVHARVRACVRITVEVRHTAHWYTSSVSPTVLTMSLRGKVYWGFNFVLISNGIQRIYRCLWPVNHGPRKQFTKDGRCCCINLHKINRKLAISFQAHIMFLAVSCNPFRTPLKPAIVCSPDVLWVAPL